MKRTTLNFIIDLVAFLGLLGLAFAGFIMKYILPPGSGGRGRMLRGGRGAGDVVEQIKELWSMTRHEWGDVHFYLAVLFAVLMVVHIILHWGWIKNSFKLLFGFSFSRKTTRAVGIMTALKAGAALSSVRRPLAETKISRECARPCSEEGSRVDDTVRIAKE